MTREGKIILVVNANEDPFNYRSDIEIFRLISARNTTPSERRKYEKRTQRY